MFSRRNFYRINNGQFNNIVFLLMTCLRIWFIVTPQEKEETRCSDGKVKATGPAARTTTVKRQWITWTEGSMSKQSATGEEKGQRPFRTLKVWNSNFPGEWLKSKKGDTKTYCVRSPVHQRWSASKLICVSQVFFRCYESKHYTSFIAGSLLPCTVEEKGSSSRKRFREKIRTENRVLYQILI